MTQTPAARAAALSTIDKEIEAARQLTRSLLSRRNTLALISVLPPELLARIFHFHAFVEPAWSTDVRRLGWIAVTHVCQRWRQVALDDSSLWTRISGYSASAEWIAETLVRARNAPLVVDLVGTPIPEILAMFPGHISHTRELRLRNLSQLHSQTIREICELEAPELEDFELGLSIASPFHFDEIVGKTLFKGRTPKLRTLSLAQLYIPWSLIPRGQLTQLKVVIYRGDPIADLSPADLDQLFDLLINSPQLEILALEFCLPKMLSQVSHGQPIHLPHLSRLSVGGPTSRVANLLKRLTIPSSATLHLRCISETSPTYNDHLILPLVASHFHGSAPMEFKSLRVTGLERLIDVAASISPPSSPVYHPHLIDADLDNQAELTLSFDGLHDFGPSNQADMIRQICRILPISNLEFLSISASDTVQSVDWYQLFQRCKKVTTIQASGRGTTGLLQSLAPPKPTNTPSGSKGKKRKGKRATQGQGQAANNAAGGSRATSTAAPFPKLTSLLLENLNFNITVSSYGMLGDALINILRRRKTDSKTPVKTLTVDNCVITASRANSMQKHVEDFIWDGDEGPQPVVYPYDDWDIDDDYSSDFIETGARLEDYFHGTTQAEWEWFANYSDGY
jgi:hypothetical protein